MACVLSLNCLHVYYRGCVHAMQYLFARFSRIFLSGVSASDFSPFMSYSIDLMHRKPCPACLCAGCANETGRAAWSSCPWCREGCPHPLALHPPTRHSCDTLATWQPAGVLQALSPGDLALPFASSNTRSKLNFQPIILNILY
jgi:hypothetical protein